MLSCCQSSNGKLFGTGTSVAYGTLPHSNTEVALKIISNNAGTMAMRTESPILNLLTTQERSSSQVTIAAPCDSQTAVGASAGKGDFHLQGGRWV